MYNIIIVVTVYFYHLNTDKDKPCVENMDKSFFVSVLEELDDKCDVYILLLYVPAVWYCPEAEIATEYQLADGADVFGVHVCPKSKDTYI